MNSNNNCPRESNNATENDLPTTQVNHANEKTNVDIATEKKRKVVEWADDISSSGSSSNTKRNLIRNQKPTQNNSTPTTSNSTTPPVVSPSLASVPVDVVVISPPSLSNTSTPKQFSTLDDNKDVIISNNNYSESDNLVHEKSPNAFAEHALVQDVAILVPEADGTPNVARIIVENEAATDLPSDPVPLAGGDASLLEPEVAVEDARAALNQQLPALPVVARKEAQKEPRQKKKETSQRPRDVLAHNALNWKMFILLVIPISLAFLVIWLIA
jgi:hypothetical protein